MTKNLLNGANACPAGWAGLPPQSSPGRLRLCAMGRAIWNWKPGGQRAR